MRHNWDAFLDDLHQRLGDLLARTEAREEAWERHDMPRWSAPCDDGLIERGSAGLAERLERQQTKLNELDGLLAEAEAEALGRQRRAHDTRARLADWVARAVESR